ncbi:DedA family protein [Gulosibacter sp. 10]|uniref:DedA family protein n=1 Tax=Gulosibacter sp. 10 TaxID=1255570 RepID=UPI00097EFB15|nr:DedA family protein [Gulosibacter sp. 10]SJM70533.1 DedA-like protein [Gulosibacter sp. 10]
MINDLLDWVIGTVQQLDPTLLVVFAGLGVLLETSVLVGLVVPGDTILLVASMGVSDWGLWAAVVLSSIVGALIGESIGYWIGTVLGAPLKRSWVGRKIGAENWDRAHEFLQRRGGIAVFISRFLPVLHSLVPVTAGITGMPFRKFFGWTLPACVIWSLAYVSAGALATASYEQLSQQLSWAGYVFIGIIVVFVVLVWLVKRWLSRRVAEELDSTD